MKYPANPIACLVLVLLAVPAVAANLACRPGQTHASIADGSAVTVNLSEIKQAGQICLKLVDDRGAVAFDECGSLLGLVTGVDPATGAATSLSHKAVFDAESSFQTVQDQPLYFIPTDPTDPEPCSFLIGEAFTHLKAGTGLFQGGALNVEAQGTVSFCPGDNRNRFTLTGEACLRRGR